MRTLRAMALLAAAAAVLMAPAFVAGAGATDSAIFNYVWTKQFAAALAHGELYPRWMPASFEGLGSPAFYFYPPFAFAISGLMALALPVPAAITAAATLLLFGSGAAMWLWLRDRTRHALAGGLLYMAAPYHLMDLYMRGALAEFAAFLWLPLIALAVDRIERRWGPAALALAYAGLIYTHLPVAVLAGLFLVAPLALLRRPFSATALWRTAAGGLMGVLLAAPYLLPALTLRGAIHNEVFATPYFQPGGWSLWAITPINADRLRVCALLAAGWTALAIRGRSWLAVTALAATCGLALVPLVWSLPALREVQFPWRLLAVVEFAAITAAVLRPPSRAFVALGAILLAGAYIPMLRTAAGMAREPLPARLDSQMTDGVEYLPSGFRAAALRPGSHPDLASLRGPLVQGPAAALATRPDGALSLQVTAPGRVVVRRANFPAWRVRGPSGDVAIRPGPLIAFEAAPGRYEVARRTLPVEWLGRALALAAALALAGLGLIPRRASSP